MQHAQFQLHADLEQRHWWFTARRTILRSVVARICPPDRDRLVLDIGCGTGGNTAAFAAEYTCIGIDPVADAVAAARERFSGVEFRIGTVPSGTEDLLPRTDVALLLDVLEHVEDDVLLVSQILDGMRPGAHLVIAVPADPSLWSAHDRGFEHYRRYTVDRLRAVWLGLPVTERLVTPWNARLYPLVKLARMFSRLRGKATGHDDTDLAQPAGPVNALLRHVFTGEKSRLLRMLDGRARPYRRGVSLLAVLRREAGSIVPRESTLPPDPRPWME